MSKLNSTQRPPFWYITTSPDFPELPLLQETTQGISNLIRNVSCSYGQGPRLASPKQYYCGECGCEVTYCVGWCGTRIDRVALETGTGSVRRGPLYS